MTTAGAPMAAVVPVGPHASVQEAGMSGLRLAGTRPAASAATLGPGR
jgi:hypothetical protein